MKSLRQQMQDAMVLRGFSLRTQESYLECVTKLAKHYHRSPDLLSADEVQAYLLFLIEVRKLSYSTVNQAASAFRFLFHTVLKRPDSKHDIPMAKVPKSLPAILTRQEVAQILAAAPDLRARVILSTCYATGVRVSELCNLRVEDIESAADRMLIKVRDGKGGKDRYTVLSPQLLTLLRQYWQAYHSGAWLFPNKRKDGPMGPQTPQRLFQAMRQRAGIARKSSIHTLRHCFATHLLEAGVDLHTIQRLMGHGHITTTTRYFHLAQAQLGKAHSPLELLQV